MKKTLIILTILSILIMSCGKQEKQDVKEKTEVIFWHAMGGPLGKVLNEMIDDFNNQNPDLFIKAVSMGNYTALSQKIMASIQADNSPDIVQSYESWTASLVDGHVLTPISELIANDPDFTQADIDDIYPKFIESNTLNDTLWTLPFNKSVRCLYYNKDIFYKNGIDPNTPPETWDDFLEYSEKIVSKNDGLFATSFTTEIWQFENLILQAGGRLLNDDYTKAKFNSDAAVEALQFYKSLLDKKYAYLSTGYQNQSDFLAGKLAMVEGSSVSMVYMQKGGINFNMGIAAVPYHKTKKNLMMGTNIALFKKADDKVKNAAWRFIKWFTDKEQTAKWSAETYYMPVRKSAFQVPILKDRLNSNPEIASVYEQLQYAESEPPTKTWQETRKAMEEKVVEKVLRNKLKAKEALDQLAKEYNEKMNKEKN